MAAASTTTSTTTSITTTSADPSRVLNSISPSTTLAFASGLPDLTASGSPLASVTPGPSQATAVPGATGVITDARGRHNNSTGSKVSTKINVNNNSNSDNHRSGNGDGNGNGNGNGNGYGKGNNSAGVHLDPRATTSPSPDLRLYPRDGRVRNPVPSKLKDVADEMRNNFSVMHMDVSSHRESQDRDAAAKLTSESTARQARLAQTDSYISHHRRANYPRPPGLKQFTSSSPRRPDSSSPAGTAPKRPLTVAETKSEQARLLTLLRTLPPHTVVDQICKALAFFGGIPDAPPPADGKFPESAEANGSGSLFVGWFAEIFPDLERPRRPPVSDSVALQKRPRGRPKGSKASKVRSDKGVKKGAQRRMDGIAPVPVAQEARDDSWVDIEDSVLQMNGGGHSVETDAPPTKALSTPSQGAGRDATNATPATGSMTGFKSINEQIDSTGHGARRRGRPKGSKNRPKDLSSSQNVGQSTATVAVVVASQPVVPLTPVPPKVTPVPIPTFAHDAQTKKPNSGRPKGSKNRSKGSGGDAAAVQPQLQPSDIIGIQGNHAYGQVKAMDSSSLGGAASPPLNGISPQGDIGLQLPAQPGTSSDTNNSAPPVKESTIVGVKRKHQVGKVGDRGLRRDDGDPSLAVGMQAQAHNPSINQSPAPSQSESWEAREQPASADASTPVAKRPRKSKDTSATRVIGNQTPNNPAAKDAVPAPAEMARQATQANMASHTRSPTEGLERPCEQMAPAEGRNDQMQNHPNCSQRQSPQSPLPIGAATSQSPAEGLEAHYERFASLQNHRHDSASQPAPGRPQRPQQTASPTPIQASKSSLIPVTRTPQPQARAVQNYYAQPQTLAATYNTTQVGFAPPQRPQQQQQQPPQQMHANPPQFGTQASSPLMQGDSSYRTSPTPAAHSSSAFVPRRTQSAAPLDTTNYRPSGPASQGLSSQSPQCGSRPNPVMTDGASHSNLHTPFQAFSTDTGFLDISGLDTGNCPSGMGLGTSSYGPSGGTTQRQQHRQQQQQQQQQPPRQQQQRTPVSATTPAYSQASGPSNYLGPGKVGRASQNRWPS
ncbi:hypothetical protein DL762_010651 [Monosporascus cannonballus]|uniref:Uncharacterized protein n=1 Tax=Monosporascus cannonballus TaxID=155416 RepID=A0ABY0GQB5_9PEZI|nr:hypothetical protein DL762_010651 [Monosporascus cannonballus]